MRITATEFQQNVGRYQDAAQREPVTITRNGRDHAVLVSADFFEMLSRGQVARYVEELDDATVGAIAETRMQPRHDHLDKKLT